VAAGAFILIIKRPQPLDLYRRQKAEGSGQYFNCPLPSAFCLLPTSAWFLLPK
jgi:hypothetical protein